MGFIDQCHPCNPWSTLSDCFGSGYAGLGAFRENVLRFNVRQIHGTPYVVGSVGPLAAGSQ